MQQCRIQGINGCLPFCILPYILSALCPVSLFTVSLLTMSAFCFTPLLNTSSVFITKAGLVVKVCEDARIVVTQYSRCVVYQRSECRLYFILCTYIFAEMAHTVFIRERFILFIYHVLILSVYLLTRKRLFISEHLSCSYIEIQCSSTLQVYIFADMTLTVFRSEGNILFILSINYFL